MHRNERFFEKLHTDVTVADLIGDVDPIKAATLKLSYADEKVIHYGMIPRAHRCILCSTNCRIYRPEFKYPLFNFTRKEIQIEALNLRLPLKYNLYLRQS